MKNWKTTLCGAVAASASIVATFNFSPLVTKISLCLAAVAGGLIGVFSKDHDNTDDGTGKVPITISPGASLPTPPRNPLPGAAGSISMVSLFSIGAAALFFSGCALNRQYATTTDADGVTHTARSTTLTLFDAKAVVDKTRATAGKTASAGATGVNEESNTGNIATNLSALTGFLNALKTP